MLHQPFKRVSDWLFVNIELSCPQEERCGYIMLVKCSSIEGMSAALELEQLQMFSVRTCERSYKEPLLT